MEVSPVNASQTTPVPRLSRTGEQGFSSMLTKASRTEEARGLSEKQQIRRAADQLVASALLKPMFKQMQSSPFRVERFHGGQGERAFNQQLHTVLADRISQSANFAVGDAIYEKMTRQLDGAGNKLQSDNQVNIDG